MRPAPMFSWPTSLLPITPSGRPTSSPLAAISVCGYFCCRASSQAFLARKTALTSFCFGSGFLPQPSRMMRRTGLREVHGDHDTEDVAEITNALFAARVRGHRSSDNTFALFSRRISTPWPPAQSSSSTSVRPTPRPCPTCGGICASFSATNACSTCPPRAVSMAAEARGPDPHPAPAEKIRPRLRLRLDEGRLAAHHDVAAGAVRAKLAAALGPATPVYLAMRYGNPSITERRRPTRRRWREGAAAVPAISPTYAMSSWETVVVRVRRRSRNSPRPKLRVTTVQPFYADPDYIGALHAVAAPLLAEGYDHLLFSYHGIRRCGICRKADSSHAHCLTVDGLLSKPARPPRPPAIARRSSRPPASSPSAPASIRRGTRSRFNPGSPASPGWSPSPTWSSSACPRLA